MYRDTKLWSTAEYLYSLSFGSLSCRMYTILLCVVVLRGISLFQLLRIGGAAVRSDAISGGRFEQSEGTGPRDRVKNSQRAGRFRGSRSGRVVSVVGMGVYKKPGVGQWEKVVLERDFLARHRHPASLDQETRHIIRYVEILPPLSRSHVCT